MKTKLILTGLVALAAGAAGGYYFKSVDTDFRTVMDDKNQPAIAKQASAEIRETLSLQEDAWNRGDIDAFMQTYKKSEDLRFASGGSVKYGWKTTLDGYKARYSTDAKMGKLSFTELRFTILDANDALVFGRWTLIRKSDEPGGLFTLHMRKLSDTWVIVSDHTSSND